MTNGTWSPLVTSKSFNCSPHASHSGLQWLLGVTCEDYTNVAFATILQGGKKSTILRLKLNLVPTIVALAFFTQIISRSIVFAKVGTSSHGSGNELISTGFYTLVFIIIFFSYITFNVLELGLRFGFIFGHISYLILCLQIFCQSKSIRKFMFHKYPILNRLRKCFHYKVESLEIN